MPESTSQTSHRPAVFVEPTPNPNSLKFIVGREIVSGGSYEFATAAEAGKSFLATELFGVDGVDGVFIGRDFVTVRKTADADWGEIEPRALTIIEDGVASPRPIVSEGAAGSQSAAGADATESEVRIRKILDQEIRPAVAGDGGDVVFKAWNDGVLTLQLVGACSGCPSSTMTLRMGIERRLREDIPELKEVVSVM